MIQNIDEYKDNLRVASEWILNWKDLSSALVAQDRRWPWVGDGMILSAGTK